MEQIKIIQKALSDFLERQNVQRVWYSDCSDSPPIYAYQVNFSRLTLVLSGHYDVRVSTGGQDQAILVAPGDAVYISAHCWDLPGWQQVNETLTLMFAHRQIGFSLNRCTGSDQLEPLAAGSVPTPLTGAGIHIQKAVELLSSENGTIACLLVRALLEYTSSVCSDSLTEQIVNKTRNRWQTICLYLQRNFGPEITRNRVAEEFAITPNHLSRLFRQEGNMGFNDYLTFVRIDRAKLLLRRYRFNLDEVAQRSGFRGGDYLGRVFRKQTGHTPGDYRAKYGCVEQADD